MKLYICFALFAIGVVQVFSQRFGQNAYQQSSSRFGQNNNQQSGQSSFGQSSFGQNNYQQSSQSSFGQSNYQKAAPSQSRYSCPERNGTFPTSTCDGYIECKDGVAEEKLCPEGLLFNAALSPQAYPCQYPIDVDCSGRTSTQPAQPTEDCPHQYGYFKMGDAQNCGQFKNCVEGRGFIFDCPEGLAWNSETYRCDWPDQVPDCDAEAFLGFKCPNDAKALGFGEEEYRFFRSQNDCQRYFVCVNSRPRLYNCGEGRAFNDLINACDGIENVTGCSASYNAKYDTKQQKNVPRLG